MSCDWCQDTRWIMLDYEKESHGFVYAPCPKCCYPVRVSAPIPAPVDALAFISDTNRIVLGEDEAWRQHEEAQQL